jgi:hypothetical protein
MIEIICDHINIKRDVDGIQVCQDCGLASPSDMFGFLADQALSDEQRRDLKRVHRRFRKTIEVKV